MNFCAQHTYVNKMIFENEGMEDEVDTNLFQVNFNILKDYKDNLHQGDPIFCSKCKAVLNMHSQIAENQEQLNQSCVWKCEFCSEVNQVQIEKEEIPKGDDVIYMVQPAQEGQQEKGKEQSIVMCLDASGSMATTKLVQGKVQLKHGISNEEIEMLRQFMEPGDEAQLNLHKNVTHISRKQCVLAAVESQIEDIKHKKPNQLVGLVSFNDDVTLYGDGTHEPVVIAGDRLNNQEDIRNLVLNKNLLNKNISDSYEYLLSKLSAIKERGQTALGPALLASVLLASEGKPGSAVIICTDGLANKGLGSFEGQDGSDLFYEQIAQFAMEKGIAVSLVSIKGEGCKLDILTKLAEQTNGYITKVDPEDISSKFANILADEVTGTNASIKVQLHKALKFKNEEEGLNAEKDLLSRFLGNTTVKTTATFEYGLKSKKQVGEDFNLDEQKQFPFQVRIEYTSLKGDKVLRVLTKMTEATKEKKEAERHAKVNIMHKRARQEAGKMARKGEVSKAKQYNQKYSDYISKNEVFSLDQDNQLANQQYAEKNQKLVQLLDKKEMQQEKQEQKGVDDVFADFQMEQQHNQKQMAIMEEDECDMGDLFDCCNDKD